MHRAASHRSSPFTARRALAVLAALASGWAGYALYGQVAQDRAMSARVEQLTAANAALQQQIDERLVELTEAQGPAWVEEQARKLGFHLPGETIYVIPPPGSTPPPASKGATPPLYGVATPTPSPASTRAAPGG